MAGEEAEGSPDRLCWRSEQVVPIVVGRAKALDGGMQGEHGASHGVTGGIGVEAAADLATLLQQGPQPARVGAGAGGGEALVSGMEGKATEGIDGRFAKDHLPAGRQGRWMGLGGNGEAAQVFLGARGQATPSPRGGAAKLGADGEVLWAAQQEDGVGPGIGVEGARVDERRQQHGGQAALSDQVVSDARQLAGRRRWQP